MGGAGPGEGGWRQSASCREGRGPAGIPILAWSVAAGLGFDLEQEKDEQRRLIEKLEEAQNQLLQSEKLASIGQLAAGAAHEINNPVGFVNSNFGALERYVLDLFRLIDAYGDPASAPEAAAIRQQIDYDFLKEDIVALFKESKDGLDRVKRIVQDLRDFSRVDSVQEWQKANLQTCLETTLNVATKEIKHKADVVRAYAEIPEIECLPSQLNQVFLNLMVNAAQAIAVHGTLTLATGCEGDGVWVSISDTGGGIAPENLNRIFDPFFTTKPVGKETGLGLSVSYNIIAKHNGRIEVESEVGKGTTFRIWLPIIQPKPEAAAPTA